MIFQLKSKEIIRKIFTIAAMGFYLNKLTQQVKYTLDKHHTVVSGSLLSKDFFL